jgi:predicted DNA-binding transcriptional regulator AlpA
MPGIAANTPRERTVFVRFRAVASDLGIHPRTLQRLVNAGRFPAPSHLNRFKVYAHEVAEEGKRALIRSGIAAR